MEASDPTTYFEQKNVKPTANRILVLRALQAAGRPLSLTDLECKLLTLNKSSIFRVLTLFVQHDIVHAFEDGRGILNYELCACAGDCDHRDGHVHFYCEHCHRSYCMDEISLPTFHLPPDFRPRSFSFVIKGTCPQCTSKRDR